MASQTQLPATHRFPVPHAGCVPQLQVPAAEQLSARAMSHDTQAAPFVPQATSEGMLQFGPEQHPSGHEVAVQLLQTPLAQAPFPPQSWQAAPPLPHAALSVPLRQMPSFEQHPVGQEVPSQTQAALTQRLPSGHIGPVPQRQLPADVHRSALIPQSRHTPPGPPHELGPCCRQTFPSQQPLGQEVASQMQLPPTQRWRAAQAGPRPQLHTPAVLQLSAVVKLHSVHAPPAVPQ